MMVSSKMLRRVVLISLGTFIIGCTAETIPPKPTFVAPSDKVTIVLPPVAQTNNLPFDLATALDLYKQEGLEVTVTNLGVAEAILALTSGSVEFIGSQVTVAPQAQGVDLRMIVSLQRLPSWSILVRGDMKEKIKTIADFKGRTIGIAGLAASPQHMLLQYVFTKAGLKREDVQIIAGGSMETVTAAFERGDMTAVADVEPYTTYLIKQSNAYTVINLSTEEDALQYIGGEYHFGVMTTGPTIKSRPQTVQKMVNAMVKALRYIATHDAAAIATVLPDTVTGKDKALYVEALRHHLPAFSKNGQITETGIKNVIEINKAFGAIKSDQQIDPSTLYTNDFVMNVR